MVRDCQVWWRLQLLPRRDTGRRICPQPPPRDASVRTPARGSGVRRCSPRQARPCGGRELPVWSAERCPVPPPETGQGSSESWPCVLAMRTTLPLARWSWNHAACDSPVAAPLSVSSLGTSPPGFFSHPALWSGTDRSPFQTPVSWASGRWCVARSWRGLKLEPQPPSPRSGPRGPRVPGVRWGVGEQRGR